MPTWKHTLVFDSALEVAEVGDVFRDVVPATGVVLVGPLDSPGRVRLPTDVNTARWLGARVGKRVRVQVIVSEEVAQPPAGEGAGAETSTSLAPASPEE